MVIRSAALIAVMSSTAAAQVLNGSFENNSAASTQFNLSNAGYNATVADSVSFGTAQEADLIDSSGFGNMTPFAGNWMVGVHNQTTGLSDAISLQLASPLVVNQTYTIFFAGAQLNAAQPGTLQVGTSPSANAFGTPLFSATPASDNSWTLFGYTFTALSPDSYITFGITGFDGYCFIDNVSIVPAPGAAALLTLVGAAAARRRR